MKWIRSSQFFFGANQIAVNKKIPTSIAFYMIGSIQKKG